MSEESRSSTPAAESPGSPDASAHDDRRKSGRAVRRPELFAQENHSVNDALPSRSKRKRASDPEENGEVDTENDASEVDDDEEDESDSNDEPDEEELRAQRRAARRAPKKKTTAAPRSKPKPPAAKKPKVAGNGINGQLAIRTAVTNGKPKAVASRSRKVPSRFSFAAGGSGLYAEVFAKGRTVDAAAAEWLRQYQRDKVLGMCDMVNFILRCSGTDLQVDAQKIEDVDHTPECIKDLQNDYQQQGITDYPLISKARNMRAFPAVLQNFFTALTQTLHHSSVMYEDGELFENLQTWVSSLSTAGCRPFRHTATFISLTVTSALCELAREVTTTVSTSRKQLESEKKKKTVNKGRAGAIQTAIQEGDKKLEKIDELLKDSFDTVFVHRYRDVDGKIRAECMAALGQWIRNYREFFFEGQYLRYFGWVLSDTSAHTRSVVVAQLHSLFENKDNLAGLRSFTERFRGRLVEMAARDAEVGVRAATVELLDLIRDAGLIEPADIDTVGRLVFDQEPRVRKAAGRFFVANVQDVFESTVDEVSEELNELFGDEDEDEYESPKRSWIKYKCLVDILQTYDEQENELKPDRAVIPSRGVLSGSSIDTRFVLATEAIYPHLEELAHWQSLAGYLLYDHSQIPAEPTEDDTAGAIRSLYKMKEGQEVTLLEVLCCAVKLRILDISKSDIDKRGRKIKTLTEKISELQEEIAHNLAQIIPQLLKKYGAVPEAATAVLRLEHLVDLDKIQDLQKDATAYSFLLNDINKQFLTHSDQDVLAEASVAFIHAKSSEEMKEALESKIQELWDDMIDALTTLSQQKNSDDSMDPNILVDLSHTVTRISNLASATDCTNILESMPSVRLKSKKSKADAPFNTLIHLIKRGLRQQSAEDHTAIQETEMVVNSIRTLLFYFMWKVQGMVTALNSGKANFSTAFFESITKGRETFAAALVAIMTERSGLDEIRFAAASTFLDLQTLFGTLRHAGRTATNEEDVLLQTQSLVHEISPDVQNLIMRIHGTAERTYAKKIGRPLEPDDDDAPASESDEEDAQSDDEDDGVLANERLRSTIIAEHRLCELTGKIVLAIIGRVLDCSGSQRGKLKQKLLKNKSRLGHNYREVLAFLTERKPAARSASTAVAKHKVKSAAGQQLKAKASSTNAKSAERVEDEEEDHDHEVEGEIEDIEDEDDDDEANLRARELVEDDIVDDDYENENEANQLLAPDPDEDEIMGD